MASRSSSPSSATKTITRLFAVRGYAKLGQMPPGTPSTKLQTLYLNCHLWHIKAIPCGFVDGVPGSVAVHVSTMTYNHIASGTNISIEILDRAMESTVFRTEQVLGDHAWSKHLMVDRSTLEAAGCVRTDYIPVRITLTFFDEKKHKRQQRAAARAEWCHRLKRSIFDTSSLNLNLGLVLPKCQSSKTEKVLPESVMFRDTAATSGRRDQEEDNNNDGEDGDGLAHREQVRFYHRAFVERRVCLRTL